MARSPRRSSRAGSSARPTRRATSPRGFRRNRVAEKPGAERAIDLLLAKLAGETRTEVAGGFDRVPPPPPVPDLSTRAARPRHRGRLRAAGESRPAADDPCAGLAPLRARRRATPWPPSRYESVHGGFDVTLANEDPNRLVPLDTVRALVEPRAGSGASTTSSTRRPGTARPSRPRRASGGRSPPS